MNWRNSSDLGSSSAGRSTFRHTTPQQPWIPTPRSPVVFSLTKRLDRIASSRSSATNVKPERRTDGGWTLAKLEPSVTSAEETSEVDTWRLHLCRHTGANKDGHSLLLLKPGLIQAHVYISPKTDREVISLP